MVRAIRKVVTIQKGGVIELQSDELRAGEQTEIIVLLAGHERAAPGGGDWQRFAGSINSGQPRAADNSVIDADIAREAAGGA